MEVSYRDFLVPVTRRESLVSFRLAFDGIIKLLTVEISHVPFSQCLIEHQLKQAIIVQIIEQQFVD
jgi:hypothetical protein